MNKGDEVYLVKYALTNGIKKVIIDYITMDTCNVAADSSHSYFVTLKQVVATEKEAIKVAEEMRLKEIRSLRKKLDKLENMTIKLEG